MTKINIISPKSLRAQNDFTSLTDNFYTAFQALSSYKELSLKNLGIDWNPTTLKFTSKGQMRFSLGGASGNDLEVGGSIYDQGNLSPVISISRGGEHVGKDVMTNDYIVTSLSEAIGLTSKLEIKDGTEFLPSGEQDKIRLSRDNGIEDKVMSMEYIDEAKYRAFAAELLHKSKGIILGKKNDQFGKYIVVHTPLDWFVAYNKSYGEAPYVVANFNDLLMNKQELIDSGNAIRSRRDPRGDWRARLREFIEDNSSNLCK